MVTKAPIGVFDSGLGGLSVVQEIRRQLPGERVVYYGDSAHAPYGVKSVAEVRELSFAAVRQLLEYHVKAVVIACNTATSATADELRQAYELPIIGMEPALKVACERGGGKPQNIIVAATQLTLKERKFAALMDRFNRNHVIFPQPCPRLVDIVEKGRLDDHELVMRTLHEYFDHYESVHIDSLVLGCTHFVFYRSALRQLLTPGTAVIDGNEGTVRHLADTLARRDELAPANAQGNAIVLNSDTSERLATLSASLLTQPLVTQ